MKTSLTFCLAVCVSIFLVSCKTSSPVAPANDTGTPTAIGTPIGSPSIATIDAAGGSVTSPDGRLEVIIPAGALSAATTISIQPGTNETPLGTGVAYSLTPHGQKFDVPVTLRFHYDSNDRAGTDIKVMTIATQRDDRIWYAYKNINLDSAASTLTIATKHFSWYSIADFYWLIPFSSTVEVKKSIEMRVVGNSINPYTIGPDADGDSFWALHSSADLTHSENMSWSVNEVLSGNSNEGYINQGDYNGPAIATYVAPQTIKNMKRNPATVTAVFSTPAFPNSEIHLLSNIKVKGDSVKVYKIDVDFKGTKMNDVVDIEHGYTQHASFTATVYPDRDSIVYGSIENFNGQISGWKERYNTCIHTATSQGDFMHITGFLTDWEYQSVPSGNPIRIYPHVVTSMTGISFTTDCGQGAKTTTGTKYEPVIYAPGSLFILDGTKQTIVDPVSANFPGVVVTFTLTPQ